jgi:hypothetical protein
MEISHKRFIFVCSLSFNTIMEFPIAAIDATMMKGIPPKATTIITASAVVSVGVSAQELHGAPTVSPY